MALFEIAVIAGSEGVPDALQTCHTLEKSFRSNVSHITLEMQNLNGSINNFSGQVSPFFCVILTFYIFCKFSSYLTVLDCFEFETELV